MNYDDNPQIRNVLLPKGIEEALVEFNRTDKIYIQVPEAALLKHKDELIKHALGQEADLSGWHGVVKNPHAIAHVMRDGVVVLEVPPILTRLPTVNPKKATETLTAAAERHEREVHRLPIAAEKKMAHAIQNYPRPKVVDHTTRNMWITFLEAFGAIPKRETVSEVKVDERPNEDDFIFD